MPTFVTVANTNDLKPGEGKAVEINGKEIALFNVNGRFYAIDNTCVHKGGPLGEGEVADGIVTCPWHGWQYDVTTGINPLNSQIKVKKYEVMVEGYKVKVKVK